MVEKLFYSMGEVTEMFDVTPALIRYWCEQFNTVRPKRNAKGNRLFSPKDVEQLKLIYHLLKEKRMTIEGAKKAMRRGNLSEESISDIELLEHLQNLRAMLVEVRDSIGEEEPTPAPVPASTAEDTPAESEEGENEATEGTTEKSKPRKRGSSRRKRDDEGVIERPLFPFYEQTLF
ncbi:MAG: MerR family transcriptional regulator [Alistipes sp.]|nr:MerR family transcriptional regulator [Alistipes sp.]